MTARIAAEYPELVLQGYDLRLSGIEESGSRLVVLRLLLANLPGNALRIVVIVVIIVHRNDEGLRLGPGSRDRTLQIRGECGDSAAAGGSELPMNATRCGGLRGASPEPAEYA